MIEEIEIILTVIVLVLIVFILRRLYKRFKLSRMGPPKSLFLQSERGITADKPKTSQVIGMIKCDYCGSLMPQTAISCPNCGASRKK